MLFSVSQLLCVIVILLLSGLVLAVGYHIYSQISRNGEPAIARSWLPYVGFAFELGRNPRKLFLDLEKAYGEVFGIIVMGTRMFFITDPHAYPQMFNSNQQELSIIEFFLIISQNFVGVNGDPYDYNVAKSQFSKFLFGDNELSKLTERMQQRLGVIVSDIKPGRYSMFEFIGRMVFGATACALFNDNVGKNPRLYDAFCDFDKSMPAACAGINIKYIASAAAARQLLVDSVLQNREGLSRFITVRWERIEQLRKEGVISLEEGAALQMSMIWAGVANTTPGVFWTLFYLLTHPSCLQRVVEEIDRVVDSSQGTTSPLSVDILNKLVFLNACITETLRLTSGSLIVRKAKKPVTLTLPSGKTYKFRKGDELCCCLPLTHADEEIYPNASSFVPDRWLVGETEEELMESSFGKIKLSKGGNELPPGAGFLAFGAGAGLCPGRKFARGEIKTVIVYLLRSFRLSLDEGVKMPELEFSRLGLGIFPPATDIFISVDSK